MAPNGSRWPAPARSIYPRAFLNAPRQQLLYDDLDGLALLGDELAARPDLTKHRFSQGCCRFADIRVEAIGSRTDPRFWLALLAPEDPPETRPSRLVPDRVGNAMSATYTRLGDEDLMILIGADDVRAFEVFFERHSQVAFSLAMRTLGDHGQAAEATQDAFLAVWRNRASYQPERGSSRTWLLGIVRNRAIDTWRRECRGRADLHDDTLLRRRPAPDCIEAQAAAGEQARDGGLVIAALLDELPFEQRQAVELAYFAGLTQTEIAAHLRLPLGTIKGRLRLALTKLRIALTEAEGSLDVDATPMERGIGGYLQKLSW